MSPTTGLVARESEIGFTICFDWVMRATRSAMATWLYGLIWRYAQMRERHCYASCAHLAEDMGVSRYHVMKLLRLLRTMGLIECVNPAARGVTHRYVPIPEDAWRAARGLPPHQSADEPDDPETCDPEPQDETRMAAGTCRPQTDPLVTPTNNRCDPRQQPPVAAVDTRNTIKKTSSIGGGGIAGGTPPPSASAHSQSSPKRKRRTSSRALEAFYEVTGWMPPEVLRETIMAAVGERPNKGRLRRCYATWCARGYNPRNLPWLFEWYKSGDIPGEARPRRSQRRQTHDDEWDAEKFSRWADYHDRVKKGEDRDAVKRELGL